MAFVGTRRALLKGGGGASVFTPDFYVDSTRADDSGDGLTLATAKKTFSAVTALISAGKKLGLARGSYWREQLTIPAANVQIGVVGTGDAPIIDGRDIVAATWTQPDAGTYANVWSISWTRANAAPSATEKLGLWADGVRPRFASSLSDLQTNGGWYATNRTTAATTVYIKSATDPNSSGVVYQITKRDHGIKATATNTGTVTGPIELIGAVGHYNNINGTGLTAASKVLVRDGTIHHFVTDAALVEDVIAIEGYPSFGTNWIPLTGYRDEGVGFNPVWKRPMSIGIGVTEDSTGLYFHASTNSAKAAVATVEQGYFKNHGRVALSAAANEFIIDGCYLQATNGIEANADETTINRLLMNDAKGGAGGALIGDTNSGGNRPKTIENAAVYRSAANANTTINTFLRVTGNTSAVTVRNSIIWYDPDSDGYAGPAFLWASNTALTSITFEYCIFLIETFNNDPFNIFGTPTISFDHNIYFASSPRWAYGGSLYSSIAAWRSATGQDTNSVTIAGNAASIKSTYFQGNPADGDFRLKSGIGTFGDGVSLNLAGPQSHWNWNTRQAEDGAPSRWPVPPASLSEYRTYTAVPAAWDFYP